MPTYRYRALVGDGMETSGVINAANEYDAAAKIRQNASIIVEIKPVKEKGTGLLSKDIGGNKLNIKNLSIMCSQIAISLKSGIPLARCLEMIGDQTEDKMLKKMLIETADSVGAGGSLSSSMVRSCKKLPTAFIETIRAGEESGNVERSFDEMAKYYENVFKTQSKIKSALTYPAFVVVVAVVVLIVVMAFVVPSLTKTFGDLGGELPVITVIMIAISNFFQRWWILMAIMLLAIVVAIRTYYRTENGRLVHGALQLKLPVLGKIHVMNGAAQFANTMSMLLKSGLTVDRAISITGKTLDNPVMSAEIDQIVGRIEEGRSLGECIRQCDHFPKTLKEMCAIGEETGELDNTLNVIGEFFANEADTATKDALAKLEPTMLIFLAVFAGFIVISIYLPMFTMYNLM